MARQDSPLARPRDNSSRSSTLNSRRERWGVGGGMPPVAFTTRRTFSRSKPMWRAIVGTGSPRARRLQTSALSASVMADFLVIVHLRHGATRSPIYRGGALTPRNRTDYRGLGRHTVRREARARHSHPGGARRRRSDLGLRLLTGTVWPVRRRLVISGQWSAGRLHPP